MSSYKLRPVSKLAEYVNGYPFKPDELGVEGVPVVRIRQLNDPEAEMDFHNGPIPRRNHIDTGDLIFSWSGSLSVGIWDRGPAYLNQHLFKVVPHPDSNKGWLRFLLEHSLALFDPYMHGSAMTHITRPMMQAVHVPVPPLDVQRRIADFLDDQTTRIDQIINARQQQLSLIPSLATAEYQSLIFGGPGRRVRLSTIADVRLGRQRSPQQEHGAFMTRYLRSANVFDGRFDLSDVKEMNFEPGERRTFSLQTGDLLVTEGAGSPAAVGASAVWDGRDEGLCFQNTLLRVRPRTSDILSDYLGWWARTAHRTGAMKAHASGAGILHLGADGLKRMPVPLVTLVEQDDVVRRCDALSEAEKAATSGQMAGIALLQEFKRSLISAAVSGEFDVSCASGRGLE